MNLWPLRPRLPRAAPLSVKRLPARSRVILSDAARELLVLAPGDTMSGEIDLNPAMLCLVEKMRADRMALQHCLDADPKNFAEHNRLLGEFQSAVRSIDILAQSTVAAPAEQPARAPISLSGILENTTRALTEEDREAAERAMADAVAA